MRLDVSDLACQRSGRPVLEGVSFTLEGGEALGLRGAGPLVDLISGEEIIPGGTTIDLTLPPYGVYWLRGA